MNGAKERLAVLATTPSAHRERGSASSLLPIYPAPSAEAEMRLTLLLLRSRISVQLRFLNL
jgi:hypothetical protein